MLFLRKNRLDCLQNQIEAKNGVHNLTSLRINEDIKNMCQENLCAKQLIVVASLKYAALPYREHSGTFNNI